MPEHIRALTSPEVLAVEADLVTRLIGRAEQPAHVAAFADPDGDPQPDGRRARGLDVAQRAAVASLAGSAPLLVVEGAAGAGKTKTLSATRALLARARPPDGRGDADAEGSQGRRPRDRDGRVLRGVVGPSARLAMG